MLRRTQPHAEGTSVSWSGPWVILPRQRWYRTSYALYQGTLYGAFQVSSRISLDLRWKLGSDTVELPPDTETYGAWSNTPAFWLEVLQQAQRRLSWGLENPARYNRHLDRLVPLKLRRGHILRRHTWPIGTEPLATAAELDALARAVSRSAPPPPRPELSPDLFLRDAAIAYDAAYEELRPLAALDKYTRRADRRHGGMLDLPPEDAAGFRAWFQRGDWRGAHPWEIVYGHPHGIILYPELTAEGWIYRFTVSEESLYPHYARMAVALDAAAVPAELVSGKRVLGALRGDDEIDVAASHAAITWDNLLARRPDARLHVRWDPLPQLARITPDQEARIRAAERAP